MMKIMNQRKFRKTKPKMIGLVQEVNKTIGYQQMDMFREIIR